MASVAHQDLCSQTTKQANDEASATPEKRRRYSAKKAGLRFLLQKTFQQTASFSLHAWDNVRYRTPRQYVRSTSSVAQIRRARGQISLTEQFKTQAKIDGQWTVFGLAQELDVHRNWLYVRIRAEKVPATRHPVIGHYLIPDDPELLACLRAQRARCCYR